MAIEVAMDQDRRSKIYAELTKDPVVLRAIGKVERMMIAREKLAAKNRNTTADLPAN
jgi:hypothetical protein